MKKSKHKHKGYTISFTVTQESSRRATMCNVNTGYEQLANVLERALDQAQHGKGAERHAIAGESFHDQQIVQLGEWMGNSTHFAVGQACKKAIESTRLSDAQAIAELLGAINYLAAAAIVIYRRGSAPLVSKP